MRRWPVRREGWMGRWRRDSGRIRWGGWGRTIRGGRGRFRRRLRWRRGRQRQWWMPRRRVRWRCGRDRSRRRGRGRRRRGPCDLRGGVGGNLWCWTIRSAFAGWGMRNTRRRLVWMTFAMHDDGVFSYRRLHWHLRDDAEMTLMRRDCHWETLKLTSFRTNGHYLRVLEKPSSGISTASPPRTKQPPNKRCSMTEDSWKVF